MADDRRRRRRLDETGDLGLLRSGQHPHATFDGREHRKEELFIDSVHLERQIADVVRGLEIEQHSHVTATHHEIGEGNPAIGMVLAETEREVDGTARRAETTLAAVYGDDGPALDLGGRASNETVERSGKLVRA